MKNILLLAVAVLSGFAVSAPAQSPIAKHLGHVVEQVGRDVARVADAITPHGGDRRDDRGRDDRRYQGRGRFEGRGFEGRGFEDCGRYERRERYEPRGHWETITEQVLVPGYYREEQVQPVYGWLYDHCGHRHWGIVQEGGCRRVWVPPHWETRCRQVFVRC